MGWVEGKRKKGKKGENTENLLITLKVTSIDL